MSHDVDALIERRRLRRRVSLWRALALAVVTAGIAAASWRMGGGDAAAPHIARVEISGLITSAEAHRKLLERIENNANVKGVILVVNSPGGGMTASEMLYQRVRQLAGKKPVVATFGSLAASGGYMVGLGADHILAQPSSITGSIGVLVQYPNFSGLLDHVGVDMEAIRSSPLKAQPDGMGPTPPEARAVMETLVADSYKLFRDQVSERRKLTGAALDAVADGRVVIGVRAQELGMVDALGGEDEAKAWLASEKGLAADMPVRDWKPEQSRLSALGLPGAAAALADLAGWSGLAQDLRSQAADHFGVLDGVAAVWHPSFEK